MGGLVRWAGNDVVVESRASERHGDETRNIHRDRRRCWACRPVDSHTWADLSGTGRAAWLAAISSASHKRENLKALGQWP